MLLPSIRCFRARFVYLGIAPSYCLLENLRFAKLQVSGDRKKMLALQSSCVTCCPSPLPSEPLAQQALGTGQGEERPPAELLLSARSRANSQKHLQIKSGFTWWDLILAVYFCLSLLALIWFNSCSSELEFVRATNAPLMWFWAGPGRCHNPVELQTLTRVPKLLRTHRKQPRNLMNSWKTQHR